MSEALAIHAGPADTNGKRLVIAQIGERSHRDHFDCNSQFQRQKFREVVVTKFDLGDDAHEFVEEKVIAAADAEDERTTKGLSAAIVKLADVEAEQISWLWPNRIALGKLNLLAGDPGLGKSFLLLDLAARISLGSRWPDCDEHAPTGGVVLLTAEDGLADTVRPRLDAAGADVTKIIALSGVNGADGMGQYQRQIDLQRDMPIIEQAIDQVPDCLMLGIDPISAYCGEADSHSNAEVRRMLAPLAEMAARKGIAVVCVTHLRKSDGAAVYRTMGSLAFAAASRSVWCVVRDKNDPSGRRRLFLAVKNNLGSDQSGLAFELSSQHGGGIPCIVWAPAPVTTTADEAMAPERRKMGPEPEEREDAESFLREALADGPRPTREIDDEAQQAHGISKRTLERARKQIGVKAFRETPTGPWMLKLSTPPTTPPDDPGTGGLGGLGGEAHIQRESSKPPYARDHIAKCVYGSNGHGGLPVGDLF